MSDAPCGGGHGGRERVASYHIRRFPCRREIIPSGGGYETDTVRGRVYLQRSRSSNSWRNKVDFPLTSEEVESSEGNSISIKQVLSTSIRGTRDRGRVPAPGHGGHSRHEVIIDGEGPLE